MKQLDRDPGSPGEEGTAAQARNPYQVLIKTPGAFAFSSAGFVGRMSMSMYGLGTVLLIAAITGKYGTAGTVAAAGSIGYALLSPYLAKLSDQLGQSRVLLTQVTIFAITGAAFITCAELRAPLPALLATGTLAGACMPSMSSMVRSRWSWLLRDKPRQLHSAFALESVNDEIIFVIGPALATLLATQLFPAAGVGTATVLAVAGTLLFALQRRTQPALPEVKAPRAPEEPAKRYLHGETTPRIPRWRIPASGLVTLSPAFLMFGMMFSSIDLSTVAFASEFGHRPLAGLVLGTYSLGSAVGGLWYGSRHWQSPPGHRFVVTAAITVAGVATFWLMPGLLALFAVCLVAGLPVAPTLIAGYAILEQQAEPRRRTEAMAWLGSTISVGIAAGSAVAGHIIDAHGARVSYAFAACCGTLAVLICLAGRAKLHTTDR